MSQSGKAINITRDAIIDATLKLLLNHPSDAISMLKIANSAGVSRRTVFNQFATKEALFEEALGAIWDRIGINEITSSFGALDDPYATLTRIGQAITAFWLNGSSIAVARMVIRERITFPQLTANYLNRGKRPVTRTIIRYLEALVEKGKIDIANPDLAARQFIGMINEPLVFIQILGADEVHTPEHVTTVVDEAVKIFFLRYPLRR